MATDIKFHFGLKKSSNDLCDFALSHFVEVAFFWEKSLNFLILNSNVLLPNGINDFLDRFNHSPCSQGVLTTSSFFTLLATLCQITILWGFVFASAEYASDTRSHGSRLDERTCPYLYDHIFKGFTPKGNPETNVYSKRPDAKGELDKCIQTCCDAGERRWDNDVVRITDGGYEGDEDAEVMCNAVMILDGACYHVMCKKSVQCTPVKNENSKDVIMVLVRPSSPRDEVRGWEEVLGLPSLPGGPRREQHNGSPIAPHTQRRTCIIGLESECLPGEECVPNSSGSGSCICPFDHDPQTERCLSQSAISHKSGQDDEDLFDQRVGGSSSHVATADPGKPSNVLGDIPADNVDLGLPSIKNALPKSNSPSRPASTTSPPPKHLEVSVVSKVVRLPENEVTLSAFTIPSEKPGEHYTYEWTLQSRPGGDEAADTGTMQDKNGPNLQLRHLKEGFYSFQVTVTGPDSIGKQVANVTVLPPNRINSPPVARVTPVTQVVRLPNSGAVLDGSASSDDDEIVNWRWELQQGPLGYQPHLPATNTLQLDNLTLPGNYTFKLTVVDSDDAESSAVGRVEVVKERDYPPEANAGQDVIVYLPHNAVTLYGNRSTDDRGIVSWEWTKRPGDKAVDMQNTRTPFLELSNLEEGMYTFALRVTDNSGQNSTAEVHVFVKPPTNKPPVANAGGNASISLPRTWFVLDGSKSSDDVAVVNWLWQQISGPSKAVLIPLPVEKEVTGGSSRKENSSAEKSPARSLLPLSSNSEHDYKGVSGIKVNATALTKGTYVFRLNVTDGDGNNASENTSIAVNQPVNAPPKADGGGDKTYVAGEDGPGWLIVADGSRSSDDLAITSWRWTRDPSGLAAGKVVGRSDHSPVLQVVDAVPGRYVFVLRVTDEQGAFDEDTVSIIVKPDPKLLSLVEVWLNVDAGRLTTAQVTALEARLALLLPHPAVPHLVDLRPDSASGRTVLVFYAQEEASDPDGSGGSRKAAEPKRALSQSPAMEGSVSSGGELGKVLPGPLVAGRLRKRLMQDPGLLELSVARVQTVVCQNTCSRHGVCEQSTRQCLCEAFWMQDPLRKFLGDGDSNCDWSILYVVVGACAVVVVTVFGGWAIACLCQHLCGACCTSRVAPSGSESLLPVHRSKRQQRSSHRRAGRRHGGSPRRPANSCPWSWCCSTGMGSSSGDGGASHSSHRKRSRYSLLGEDEGGVAGAGGEEEEEEEDEDEEDTMLHTPPVRHAKFHPSASEASNSDDVLFELRAQVGNRYNGIPGSRRIKT